MRSTRWFVPVILVMSECCLSAASSPMVHPDSSAVLQSTNPVVIAHRGFSRRAPENTLPAFRLGWEAGADLVELDYYHSKDGVPVVIHDPTLDRTTDAVRRWGGAKIPVTSKTWRELRELDAGQWFGAGFAGTRLPTLREVLDTLSANRFLLIERKGGDPAALVTMLRETDRGKQVIVQAFDWKFLRECHALAPHLILGALGPPSTWRGRKLTDAEKALSAEWIDSIVPTGAKVIGWNDQVDAPGVKLAHQRGLKVWVYTIDDPARARALVALGVDGIITNDPAAVRGSVAPPGRDG